MKRCPQCQQLFDDVNNFCLNDGTPLPSLNSAPTVFVPRPTYNAPASKSHTFAYVLIAILGLAVVALAAYILVPRSSSDNRNKFETVSSETKQTPESSPTNTRLVASGNNAPTSNQTTVTPTGRWNGDWSSSSGAFYGFDLTLNDQGANNLGGHIYWTLRRTTRPDKMSKIGMSATEYVSGRFDPATSTVFLKGYREDDPNNMLVMLDDYRLYLSNDGNSLNGQARNGGKWNGRINLSR